MFLVVAVTTPSTVPQSGLLRHPSLGQIKNKPITNHQSITAGGCKHTNHQSPITKKVSTLKQHRQLYCCHFILSLLLWSRGLHPPAEFTLGMLGKMCFLFWLHGEWKTCTPDFNVTESWGNTDWMSVSVAKECSWLWLLRQPLPFPCLGCYNTLHLGKLTTNQSPITSLSAWSLI